MAGSISSTDSASSGSSGASSSSKEARKAARASGSQPGRLSANASASNSAMFVLSVWCAVAIYDRCGVLWCVALCSLSVDRCAASGQRFFCSARVFLASVVTNAASRLLLLYIGTALAPFLGCSRPLSLSRRGSSLACPRLSQGCLRRRAWTHSSGLNLFLLAVVTPLEKSECWTKVSGAGLWVPCRSAPKW